MTPAVSGKRPTSPLLPSPRQRQLVQPRASPQLWATRSRESRLERSCGSSREGAVHSAALRRSRRVFLDTWSHRLRQLPCRGLSPLQHVCCRCCPFPSPKRGSAFPCSMSVTTAVLLAALETRCLSRQISEKNPRMRVFKVWRSRGFVRGFLALSIT